MSADHDLPLEEIRRAATRGEIIRAVASLYEEVDRKIASQSPTCWNRGECCRFGSFGHRLYVTTLEIAYYLSQQDFSTGASARAESSRPVSLPVISALGSGLMAEDTCPHAHDGKCHARKARPLGCRIFYCDPAAQDWQGPMTEDYLARLREMHERFKIQYLYVDWMAVMRALAR